MCDEAVNDSLATLKLSPDWFVTSKKIKKSLYCFETIFYFNEDSGNVVFNCNGIGILDMDLKNINLNINFDEDDPDAIILIKLLAWHIKLGKRKKLKKV